MTIIRSRQNLALRKKLSESVGDIRHYAVRSPQEAIDLSVFISLSCNEPEKLQQGVCELLLNAIEHGHVQNGFEDRNLHRSGQGYLDELEKRLRSTEFKTDHIDVYVEQTDKCLVIYVFDQGAGTAARPWSAPKEPETPTYGDGIKPIPQACFDHIEYNKNGNGVSCIYLKSTDVQNCSGCRLGCPFFQA